MTQQILFIGGPLDRSFEDVETPLPPSLDLGPAPPGAPPFHYRLHYVVEQRRRHGERRWPVYVHGALPPVATVLNLWYVRATIWQVLPAAAPAAGASPAGSRGARR